MSRHHLRNFAAPSSRESAKRILEGIDEKNRNKRLLGARLQKIAVDARASPSPAEWEEFWKKHKTFQVSDDDLKMETVIPSVEMQREDEKFAVGPHSRIQERLTLADKDVEQKKNLQKIRNNIFEKHVGTSPSSPPIGTAPKIRPPKPTTSDRIRGLQARLSKQKIAVRYESSFGPDLDAIEAFKRGEDYQGYVGKGKNKRLKFEVKGDKLYLHGHNIATKTKDGIKVSNAGFDTGLTYSTLKELGINAKRTPGGKVILHNTEIDAASGQSVFVPTGEISSSPVRATKPQRRQRHNRTVTEQSNFRKDVESRERAEQGRNERELPLSSTAIQPKDQRIINKITGVKSKIPKETRATDAHHIFPVEKYPELKNNPAQGIMLTRAEHKELHDLNPTEGMRALRRRVGKLKIAERLRAFTNTSSFVGNMRYDQDEQSMTGILSGNITNGVVFQKKHLMLSKVQVVQVHFSTDRLKDNLTVVVVED